jgi:hypothetical protein
VTRGTATEGTGWLALAVGIVWMWPLSPHTTAVRQAEGDRDDRAPSHFVDPFIGTGGEGHTYPGAAVPWGIVQLSPESDAPSFRGGLRWCAGYQYGDMSILGFAHTHFSGTGHSDLGDVLLMPATGPLKLGPRPKGDPDAGYRSRFSHGQESAEPGYYGRPAGPSPSKRGTCRRRTCTSSPRRSTAPPTAVPTGSTRTS